MTPAMHCDLPLRSTFRVDPQTLQGADEHRVNKKGIIINIRGHLILIYPQINQNLSIIYLLTLIRPDISSHIIKSG